MRFGRRIASVLIGVLIFDLGLILVTGSGSALDLGGRPVGPWGFTVRLLTLGALLLLRGRILIAPGSRWDAGRLGLALLLLPTLLQFQYAGGRVNGDGMMYYVFVRSVWKDADLDLTNEYAHYDLLKRGDLSVPTRTGLRRSIFSIGPAVMWTPFFFSGEAVARVHARLGGAVDLSGYGPYHRNAVALGSLLYGFGAVMLVYGLLRRRFNLATSFLAAFLMWGATFLHWYMVQQPTYAHAPSAFLAALVIVLWEHHQDNRDPWRHFLWGLTLGLAMCVRWQNGILLLLPGLELVSRIRRRHGLGRLGLGASCLACGLLIGVFPQMAAWKALFGEWLLRYPPHSATFVRLDHPFLMNMLFSSRHGLLSWTPVFWLGYLGFVPLFRRDRRLALTLFALLAVMTYVNACAGDWWCGGSYSIRRFGSALPVFAFGIAAAVDVIRAIVVRWPQATAAVLVLPGVIWSLSLTAQLSRGRLPWNDTFSCAKVIDNEFTSISRRLGSPNTWPASWIFAWRHQRPPDQYDRLVGRYLFYLQNNMGGRIDLGTDNDDAMLGEGWSPVETRQGVTFRRTLGRARLFAPLDRPLALEMRFRTAACETSASARVFVNGRFAGEIESRAPWQEASVRAPAAFWRRELNEIALEGGCMAVDSVSFVLLREEHS